MKVELEESFQSPGNTTTRTSNVKVFLDQTDADSGETATGDDKQEQYQYYTAKQNVDSRGYLYHFVLRQQGRRNK